MDDYLTIKQLAERLQITSQHARLLVRQGVVCGLRFDGRWVVERKSAEEFAANYSKWARRSGEEEE